MQLGPAAESVFLKDVFLVIRVFWDPGNSVWKIDNGNHVLSATTGPDAVAEASTYLTETEGRKIVSYWVDLFDPEAGYKVIVV